MVSSFKAPSDSVPQKDLIDVFKSVFKPNSKNVPTDRQPRTGKVYFSFLPTASTLPDGGGKMFITSTTAGFYAGDHSTTNLSSITFTPYFNFNGRYGLPLRSNIWLSDNRWFIAGDTRLMVYPQDTWGLGGDQPESNRTRVDYRYIRFYQSLLRQIRPYFFAGVGYNMDYHMRIVTPDDAPHLGELSGYTFGTSWGQNSFSSGMTLNLLYDTRNNSINPLPGCYANLIYRVNSSLIGSTRPWQSVYLDLRHYVALNKANKQQQNTLALWTYFWAALDRGVPYLSLPSIGWDLYNRSGRGVEQNRYRGQRLWYTEAEYRRSITRNGLLGFVLFANMTTVNEPDTKRFTYFHPAGGGGLRIKFNKTSNTNIAIDYGFSKGYSSVRLNLGEAF
ncbi:BamA/TamA family outer membrane protein [Mucilaginibacter daejeonensis]|uniref:BamA/TamA family outer membrane protein n=1 Tax=Mucilaginibacter daejeonensis TaxID=398049 RepID=UPI001D17900F|nr:BamA/TamA family outer membrane protein [Mucilaginibacter daejeonensis]UEG51556.1 BamA/TamA family outer membrane protein [Mucilaginibacter daejeonensis]